MRLGRLRLAKQAGQDDDSENRATRSDSRNDMSQNETHAFSQAQTIPTIPCFKGTAPSKNGYCIKQSPAFSSSQTNRRGSHGTLDAPASAASINDPIVLTRSDLAARPLVNPDLLCARCRSGALNFDGGTMADEFRFHGSRMNGLFLLLFGAVFAGIGYFMRGEQPWLGWASMLVFGLGIPVGLFLLFSPGSTYLHLDRQGFEIGSYLRKKRFAWADVERFEITWMRRRGGKLIAVYFAPHYGQQTIGRALDRMVSDMDYAIGNDYKVPLEDIAKALNEWRDRYGPERTLPVQQEEGLR